MPDPDDISSGKVKWINGVGWCDEPFVSISLHPVAEPTEAQIRYVKSFAGYGDQNFLQIRKKLQQGGGIPFGLLLAEDVERLDIRLRELGLEYSVTKERIYRPR